MVQNGPKWSKMVQNGPMGSGFLLHQNVWKVKINYLFILWKMDKDDHQGGCCKGGFKKHSTQETLDGEQVSYWQWNPMWRWAFSLHFKQNPIHLIYMQSMTSIPWLTHYPIIVPSRGSHGLSARRVQRTKSSRPEGLKAGPKGRYLEVGPRRGPWTSSWFIYQLVVTVICNFAGLPASFSSCSSHELWKKWVVFGKDAFSLQQA